MKRLLLSALLFGVTYAVAAGDSMPPTPSAQNADVERGRKLVQNRQETGCVLCHTIPGFKDGGEMGPNLAGLSQRMTPDQIRMRIADPRVLNPQTFMPAYFSTEGLHNVAKPLIGKTVLTEQSLEDIVAYLLEATKGP
jgi:sulfur-oxidizing protein SoxX